MQRDFGLDLAVVKWALYKVDYESLEEATDFIYGGFDDEGAIKHPFFGYIWLYF